jgi:uncharacterized protein (DUF2141 family)
MIRRISIVLFICWAVQTGLSAQSSASGNVVIRFTGIRDGKGQIAIGVNRSPEGWPRKPHMEFRWKKENLENGVFKATINNLPYGTYAISVLDDTNSNLEMDMFMGVPKEGWGFSMNPPFKLSAPGFEECSFELSESAREITINMRYFP